MSKRGTVHPFIDQETIPYARSSIALIALGSIAASTRAHADEPLPGPPQASLRPTALPSEEAAVPSERNQARAFGHTEGFALEARVPLRYGGAPSVALDRSSPLMVGVGARFWLVPEVALFAATSLEARSEITGATYGEEGQRNRRTLSDSLTSSCGFDIVF